MFDYDKLHCDFVAPAKSLIIAPAGYGKTHTIAECLKYMKEHQGIESQLILTHTHAGVASIKEKVAKVSPSCIYHIETISSFAQKYVESFYCGTLPLQDEDGYFPFIIKTAVSLFSKRLIQIIISTTYKGLFVDEYQDCTLSQHNLIMEMANILPTHLLGDPLQGIFSFNDDPLVDLEQGFQEYCKFELPEPWRWKNSNLPLGESLHKIRTQLKAKNAISLRDYNGITFKVAQEIDLYNPRSDYYQAISRLMNVESSLLIIHPESTNLNSRIKLVKTFSNRIYLVEAIDYKDFYSYASMIDQCANTTFYSSFYQIGTHIFKISDFNNWFNENGCKRKTDPNARLKIEPIRYLIEACSINYSPKVFLQLIIALNKDLNIPCYRKELYFELIKAMKNSILNHTTVNMAMKDIRNIKRKVGRKIIGKCIGTTLLTKGLEFDTVVVLNAHKFTDSKNLYVALTRASKRLIVFANNNILAPCK